MACWRVSTLKQFTLSCWLHTLLIGDKFSAVWRCMMSQLRGIRLRKFRKELSRHIYLIVIRHNVQKWLLNPCIPLIFTFKKYTWTLLFHGMQVLSNTIKQKRKEKAGKWDVPLPKVRFCRTPSSIYIKIVLCKILKK